VALKNLTSLDSTILADLEAENMCCMCEVSQVGPSVWQGDRSRRSVRSGRAPDR